jgi:two-component system copper resistance phosphate regulon response regulator CusR
VADIGRAEVTDAERIAELEDEVAFLRGELALIENVTVRARAAQILGLSGQESRVFSMLYQAKGRVLSRGYIDDHLRQVHTQEREPGTKTIDVHVSRIRKQLGFGTIETVKGVGYCVPHSEAARIGKMIGVAG